MQDNFQIATLGGGCFWCIEALFRRVKGVFDVKSGFSGGNVSNPTSKQDSVEVIQFKFDPSTISYENIIRIFMNVHEPYTKDPNQSAQERSMIFYTDGIQKQTALKIIAEVNESKIYPQPVETEVAPLENFKEAEERHQNYYEINQEDSYCKAIIDPKLKSFLKKYSEFLIEQPKSQNI